MTYCVGVMLDEGMIFASDSRTHAGVDNFAKFCKMTVFERRGDRVLVLLSSGNLAGTQAVISLLKQRGAADGRAQRVERQHDVRRRNLGLGCHARRRSPRWRASDAGGSGFNASFILGGQIQPASRMRLFRIYSEGNFIEAGEETPYLQTGETKYGKPIIDRVITPSTSLNDAAKCVLVSFDSTMRSNLSVGMPIDLMCYRRDSLEITDASPVRRRRCLFQRAERAVERRHAQRVPRAPQSRVVTRPFLSRVREDWEPPPFLSTEPDPASRRCTPARSSDWSFFLLR